MNSSAYSIYKKTGHFFAALLMVVCAQAAWSQTDASPAAAAGPKKSIAVVGFDGSVQFQGADAGQGLAAMLTDELIKDGRFVVVERASVADVATEQQLNQSDAPALRMMPASVLVRGSVTKFSPKSSSSGVSIGLLGSGLLGGALGLSGDVAEVEINLRLIDAGSGRLLGSIMGKGSASSKDVKLTVYSAPGMSVGGDSFKGTPLGQACDQAIKQAIDQIAVAMDKVPWSAKVLNSDTGKIYIDAGSIQNVQVGESFKVSHTDKVLTDPATNAVVDVIESPVGSIRVTEVREKSATAVVTDGELPQPGDIVRSYP
jgi:curli biogenesis system outer membrane secretion channel CsgG